MHLRVEALVIGGGIGGVATALCLRRVGVEVALVEARADLMRGASLLPGRLHYGGMYFKESVREGHAATAHACLRAAMEFHQMFRGDIWSEDGGTVFVIDNASAVDEAMLVAFHEDLAGEFARTRSARPANYPDELLFRPLSREERDLFRNIRGGVRTLEPGVSTAKLAMGLRGALHSSRVLVATGVHIDALRRIAGGGFFVSGRRSDGEEYVCEARVVVQCAGIDGPRLDAMAGVSTSSVVTLKGATMLSLSQDSVHVPTTYLVDSGSFNFHRRGPATLPSNGMIVSAGSGAKEIGTLSTGLSGSYQFPPEWEAWLTGEYGPDLWLPRAERSLSIGAQHIPALANAEPVNFIVRGTVSHDTHRHSRTHVNVYAEANGYLATTCVKLSSAPAVAMEVARRAVTTLRGQQLTSDLRIVGLSQVPEVFTFELVHNRADALQFADSSGLSSNLVPSALPSSRWPPWPVLH